MLHCTMKFRLLFGAAALMIAVSAATAYADSAILDVVDPVNYEANDVMTGYSVGSYDVSGSTAAAWAGAWPDFSLKLFDLQSGTVAADLGTPSYGVDYYNSFTTFDPSGNSVWIGFTVLGNVDDRIYQVDLSGGGWTQRATLPSNFDLEFSGGDAFVSGLNSTGWGDPNRIWLLDTSGAGSHVEIAQVGGVSAGLAFDADGTLYYGTANATVDEALLRYSASQVEGAKAGSPLSRADAEVLSGLPGGVDYPQGAAISDVAVDAAGNVLFNVNQVDTSDYKSDLSTVALWNGTPGSGQNFTTLTTGVIPGGQWHAVLAAEGDITDGGKFYQGDFYAGGVAEVSHVPEPSTLALLAAGAVGVLLWRRRRG